MDKGAKRKEREDAPPAPPSHRILSADELGLLKVTQVPAGDKWEETAATQRWGQPDKQHGVTRLQVHCPDWDPDRCLVATARTGGRVTLHSGADGSDLGSFRAAPPATTSGRSDMSGNDIVSLRFVGGAHTGGKLLLVTATAAGHVSVHSCAEEAALQTGPSAEAGARPVVTWEDAQRLQTVGDVQAMDVSSSGRHVAVGGDGHQLRVWDLAAAAAAAKQAAGGKAGGKGAEAAGAKAPEPLFAGKAGKPSRSGLQDLAHVTAVSYVPGKDDQVILVGTAKHKLWLYDMRAGRKPQAEVVWGEGRITALLPEQDGQRVWVGNGRGCVEALDLRQAPSRVVMGHALKGMAGAVRALSLHPTQPLIASVSLDRHLRVHSTAKRSLLSKVYLKQALTGVAWLPVPPAAPAEDAEEAEGGSGDEEEQPRRYGSRPFGRGGQHRRGGGGGRGGSGGRGGRGGRQDTKRPKRGAGDD
ncbi:hypothetical protein HYH03_007621 [Edaphochlamys debaryana]|uniref:Uncharacterized protein n=1 Tax=Edaphochlamys debaryana TaxID=47281 RepID=A0A835Y1M3_9CHLO|nr:hypothetical protein HYH03_007621 [Edaphochlamys debaryana]|eukprot:KAG2494266.1 hypothetical protein HYH03_007621 [Edaphochlamys debaryana]